MPPELICHVAALFDFATALWRCCFFRHHIAFPHYSHIDNDRMFILLHIVPDIACLPPGTSLRRHASSRGTISLLRLFMLYADVYTIAFIAGDEGPSLTL